MLLQRLSSVLVILLLSIGQAFALDLRPTVSPWLEDGTNIYQRVQRNVCIGVGPTATDALSLCTAPVAGATRALINLSNTALVGGSVSGTYLGANPAAFSGNWLDLQIANVSKITVTGAGVFTKGTWQAAPIDLPYGGTNANLTASNGGIFYSTATAGAILSGTATANKVLMSGATATPTWSTPTYPNASATSGKYIKSDGTNFIASTGSASGTGACTNQAVTTVNADAAPTCTTLTSAYVDASIGVTGSSLAQFASTTSAQLAGVLSDETGTGKAVFDTNPVLGVFTGTSVTYNVSTSADYTPVSKNAGTLGGVVRDYFRDNSGAKIFGLIADFTANYMFVTSDTNTILLFNRGGQVDFFNPPKFGGTNTTGVGTGVIGATCPAVTCGAAYTWVKAVSSDGSTVYFPVWK